ncbi:MAG TPA: hypothetical protein VGM84_18945 [Steroidobacteraceae bacterium]|jgi:DNA polymerase-3 subunit delta'
MDALRAALAADRFPHALMIHEAPGAGGDWLASWVAELVMGEKGRRVAANQHPDFFSIRPVEDSKQIKIEQVRELAQELALTSHQGGYKVGVLSPADSMNRFAANALLKTLEEPPPRTLLMLVATEPSRLPATILSRCHKIRIRAPKRAEAIAWLEAARGPGDWDAVLNVLGDAPMLAAEADAQAVSEVARETRGALEDATAGRLDPVATAERWARGALPLHVKCFENWLTNRIRGTVGGQGFLTEVRPATHLPGRSPVLNIRRLFEVLDGLRDLKSTLDAPINRGLILESLLRRLEPDTKRTT